MIFQSGHSERLIFSLHQILRKALLCLDPTLQIQGCELAAFQVQYRHYYPCQKYQVVTGRNQITHTAMGLGSEITCSCPIMGYIRSWLPL